jgi:hypothetical protein
VPTLVKDDDTTVELSVVPVKVPAAAVTVQELPNEQVWVFTVVEKLTKFEFVTTPLGSVSVPVKVAFAMLGDVVPTNAPLPFSPRANAVKMPVPYANC